MCGTEVLLHCHTVDRWRDSSSVTARSTQRALGAMSAGMCSEHQDRPGGLRILVIVRDPVPQDICNSRVMQSSDSAGTNRYA